jgi:hypothetical protein
LLLLDVVGGLVRERGGVDEHDLVLRGTGPGEDVLQYAEERDVNKPLADLLLQLPLHRFQRQLAELDMAAQGTVELLASWIRALRHQQRAVARPPDHRHRLDDLPVRLRPDVVSRRCSLPEATNQAGPVPGSGLPMPAAVAAPAQVLAHRRLGHPHRSGDVPLGHPLRALTRPGSAAGLATGGRFRLTAGKTCNQ